MNELKEITDENYEKEIYQSVSQYPTVQKDISNHN